jgi:hypothetical protein
MIVIIYLIGVVGAYLSGRKLFKFDLGTYTKRGRMFNLCMSLCSWGWVIAAWLCLGIAKLSKSFLSDDEAKW